MLPTINSNSVNPLPTDLGILNFIIIDLIFLIGILYLIVKRKEIFNANNAVLDKNNSNKIKGLLSILIVIHHLSIYIKNTILFKIFMTIGIVAVAAFFFYSGYGLMVNYLKKKNYLDNFFNKRIMKIVIPYIISIILTFFSYLLTEYKLTFGEIFNSLFNGDPVVRFSWYVLTIIILYIIFYISAKFLKDKKRINISIFLGTILYCIVATMLLSLNNWWINSCFAFFIGVYWASYRDKYIKILENKNKIIKYAIIISLISLIMIVIQFLTSGYSIVDIIAHNEIADYIMKKPISVISMNIICVSLLFILLNILKKVKLNNKVFSFLGNISFEIYLYHGLVMYLLRNTYGYCRIDYVYAVLVIILSILLAKIMNIVNNNIYNFYFKFSNKIKKVIKINYK